MVLLLLRLLDPVFVLAAVGHDQTRDDNGAPLTGPACTRALHRPRTCITASHAPAKDPPLAQLGAILIHQVFRPLFGQHPGRHGPCCRTGSVTATLDVI